MIEAVSDGVPASEPLQSVRRASSYPAFLSVARLYAAGLILLMAPVGVVSCSGQGAWFFLSLDPPMGFQADGTPEIESAL
jgi:hypothetical protein